MTVSLMRWCRAYLIVALLLATVSTQEEYLFLSEPPDSYYYSYPGRVALFPCVAVRTDDSDNQLVIDPILFRNSLSMDIYFPPPRHRAWANHEGNVVGIEVNPTRLVDSGSTYQCVITENNRTSRRTTLYVGDGRPFPVTVDMVDQRLYSLSLDWSPAPAPVNAPVQGYTVLVTEPNGRQFEVLLEGNDTEADLLHLVPGTRYSIVVFARNAHGEGTRSEEMITSTVRPEAPFPPTNVDATASMGNSSSSITVTWTLSQIDPEVMTPVERYAIFYGQGPRSGLQNITTADNTTTCLTIADILQGGTYTVGVAAVNSGGVSMVTYHSQEIAPGCITLGHPENGEVVLVGVGVVGARAEYACRERYRLHGDGVRVCQESGRWSGSEPTCEVLPDFTSTTGPQLGMTAIISIAAASAVLVLLIIIFLIIIAICCMRARIKRTKGIFSSMDLGGSPSAKKKTTPPHRTHTNGESSSLSSELQVVYMREPRAVGSPPPSSLETSSSNLNVAYTHEPRAAGSPSPPPVGTATDLATSISFGKQ